MTKKNQNQNASLMTDDKCGAYGCPRAWTTKVRA
jgi:hypothetical protein